jgi:hypothetical protein
MKLSSVQKETLLSLSKSYRNGIHHPQDTYNIRTLSSLEKLGLVTFYSYSNFLHGAVKLTDSGNDCVKLF